MKYLLSNPSISLLSLLFTYFVLPLQAQETIVTYIKKNGGHTAFKDSAAYTSVIRSNPNTAGLYELNDYYPNGSLKRHGWTKVADSRTLHLEGTVETYYENGNLASSAGYKDNKLSDTVKRYHNNGLLKEIRFFFKSERSPNEFLFPERDSRLLYYADSTGRVQIKDGNGKFEVSNKKDREQGQYANGLREGHWEGTFNKGENQFEEWYEKGLISKGITTDSEGNKFPYTQREVQPEYPGGIKKLMMFVAQNYNFPKEAIKARVSGQLLISFVIEKTGIPNDFEVINDLGYGTAANGIEVIKKAQKWTPGYQYGLPVRVKYSLPIRLNLLPAPTSSKSQ